MVGISTGSRSIVMMNGWCFGINRFRFAAQRHLAKFSDSTGKFFQVMRIDVAWKRIEISWSILGEISVTLSDTTNTRTITPRNKSSAAAQHRLTRSDGNSLIERAREKKFMTFKSEEWKNGGYMYG